MPTLLIIFMSILGSNAHKSDFDYKKAWKKVDELLAQQKPESALKEIKNIAQIAIAEKNQVQLTKSIFYEGKVILITNEDGVEKVIDLYESELQKFKSPYKNILESQLADFYLQYFNTNRYQITQRLEISSTEDQDVRTMTTQSFLQKINNLYFSSIENLDSKANLEEFAPLLNDYSEEGKNRRPHLKNVLINRILNYLAQGDKRPTLPSEKFVISDSVYYKSYRIFNHLTIESEDQLSTQYRALLLFQKLSKNSKPSSAEWSSIQFDRLNFVNQHYTRSNKNKLYLNALTKLADEVNSHQIYSSICYKISEILKNSEDFESKVSAKNWAEKGIITSPNSEGARNCKRILNELEKSEAKLVIKEAYPIQRPFTIHLNYRNTSEGTLTIYKVSEKYQTEILTNRNRKIESFISDSKSVHTLNLTLNDTTYLNFTKKIEVTGQKAGVYILEFKNSTKDLVSFGLTTITNLSMIEMQESPSSKVMILNRESGSSIPNVEVTFYEQVYNNKRRRSDLKKLAVTNTNSNGIAIQPKAQRSLLVSLSNGEDFYMANDRVYSMREINNRAYNSVEIFTDRAIYRPGQTVFYKGLYLNYNEQRIPSIVKSESIKINIKDANYQTIQTIEHSTNQFGSFSGTFIIPNSGLNGNYTITTPYGGKNFKVEEYKRPTFEVKTDSISSDIALGDEVIITGIAKGYAGNPISNSKVSYTVYRKLGYPRHCYYFPYSPQKEMVETGTVKSKQNGTFSVSFKSKKENTEGINNVLYHYTVEITITDPSGESRSTSKDITLTEAKFSLSIEIEQQLDLATLPTFKINAVNTEGKWQNVAGSYKIFKLRKNNNYIENDRYNYQPVVKRKKEWEKENLVFEGNFVSNQNIDLLINNPGFYLIEAKSSDKNEIEVFSEEYVVVYNSVQALYPNTKMYFVNGLKENYDPGDTLDLQLGAFNKDLNLYYVIHRGEEKKLKEDWIKLNSKNNIIHQFTEEDRGGIQIFIVGVYNNKVLTESLNVSVPWTNKKLDISFKTFRDKIEPGTEEEYVITIKNINSERIQSELLMTLYDASLDQFTKHNWQKLFYPNRYKYRALNPIGFKRGYVYSRYSKNFADDKKYESVIYPELISYNQGGYGFFPYPRNEYLEAVPSGAPGKKLMKGMEVDEAADAEAEVSNEEVVESSPQENKESEKSTALTQFEKILMKLFSFTLNFILKKTELSRFLSK